MFFLFKGSRDQGIKGSRDQGFKGSKVQGFNPEGFRGKSSRGWLLVCYVVYVFLPPYLLLFTLYSLLPPKVFGAQCFGFFSVGCNEDIDIPMGLNVYR